MSLKFASFAAMSALASAAAVQIDKYFRFLAPSGSGRCWGEIAYARARTRRGKYHRRYRR